MAANACMVTIDDLFDDLFVLIDDQYKQLAVKPCGCEAVSHDAIAPRHATLLALASCSESIGTQWTHARERCIHRTETAKAVPSAVAHFGVPVSNSCWLIPTCLHKSGNCRYNFTKRATQAQTAQQTALQHGTACFGNLSSTSSPRCCMRSPWWSPFRRRLRELSSTQSLPNIGGAVVQRLEGKQTRKQEIRLCICNIAPLSLEPSSKVTVALIKQESAPRLLPGQHNNLQPQQNRGQNRNAAKGWTAALGQRERRAAHLCRAQVEPKPWPRAPFQKPARRPRLSAPLKPQEAPGPTCPPRPRHPCQTAPPCAPSWKTLGRVPSGREPARSAAPQTRRRL
jgi:hypothetical protein